MQAVKQSKNWRKFTAVAGLMLVLLLALTGMVVAAPEAPYHSVAQIALIDRPAAPSAPMGKSTIGNYVWYDANADGDHTGAGNDGETEFTAGIPDVLLELFRYDPGTSTWISEGTTTTDATGKYQFPATAEGTQYEVVVDPSNFNPGGPLDGYVLTSGGVYPQPFTMPNVLIYDWVTADFGFARTSVNVIKNPATQTLLPGSTATFEVIVQNTGQVILENIDLIDPIAGAVCTPDPIQGPIAPGGQATATCTVTNVQGAFINYVTAIGTPVDENGNTLPGDTPTDESGPAEVLIANPAIDVEKYVSIDGGLTWVDADTATGPYLNGATVAPQFQFVVTNTGNVTLHAITLTDSDFSLAGCTIPSTLAPGASFPCTITATWTAGQHNNKATTTGKFTDSSNVTATVSDTDDANYYGSDPEVDVEKYVSIDCKPANDPTKTWIDADLATGPYLNGATCAPQFKIVVTNTGNVALTNVDVTDSVYGPISLNGTLAVGASAEYYVTGTWAAGQHTNVATASGDYVDGNNNTETDTDTDAANYYGSDPEIDVEKYVSIDCKASNDPTKVWVDADAATGPYLNGATCAPQFKIVVTNTGNVALTNVDVTDSVYGPISLNGTLAVGASAEYYVTGTWAAGQHTNVATASGDYVDGNNNTETDTDTDDANYYGSDPEIDVEKYVSIDCKASNDPTKVWVDADAATGPYLNGATCAPQFKIVVTNTGNVPLTNVDVTDSVYGNINLDGTLAVGASAEYYVTGTWAAGQHTNVTTASGDYVDGNNNTETDTDTDAANYFGSDPKIDVEKFVWDGTAWVDADTPPGPTLVIGTNPQFRFVVTNTGNVTLSPVTLTDSVYNALIGAQCTIPASLLAGASFTCTITTTWTQGQHTNTATATGTFIDGNGNTQTPSDTDLAHYFGGGGMIGDFIWWDVNGNGIQDPGEPGIPGVTVTLAGYPPVVTDANGYYSFANLPAGTYVPTIPATEFQPGGPLFGFALSPVFVGLDPTVDSNGVPGPGGSAQASVTIGAGQTDTTIDFGFVKPTSYALAKSVVTVGPVTPGSAVQFKITIANTGQTWIDMLPVVDTFDTTYLTYVSASVAPFSVVGGTITWLDVTGAGQLAPGASIDVFVNFIAVADTTHLANQETVNVAVVPQQGTMVDPDGPGPIPPAPSPVPDKTAEDGIQIINPTGVALARAGLTVTAEGVQVSWDTADESAILGFNILRGGEAVNAELILAATPGARLGAAYTFIHAAATDTQGYALEIVGLDGRTKVIELGQP